MFYVLMSYNLHSLVTDSIPVMWAWGIGPKCAWPAGLLAAM